MPPVTFGPDGADSIARSELLKIKGPHLQIQLCHPQGSLSLNRVGLIDTGATDIIIDRRAARHLELEPIDTPKKITGVGGTTEALAFAVRIKIPDLKYSKVKQVFALQIGNMSAPVLLGRPFLQDFILNYDGPSGMFSFFDPKTGYAEPPDDE